MRVIILFLVNRLFESEEQISVDFPQYLAWSKKKDLEDLQEWIESEELANLKLFMKSVTSKYLWSLSPINNSYNIKIIPPIS